MPHHLILDEPDVSERLSHNQPTAKVHALSFESTFVVSRKSLILFLLGFLAVTATFYLVVFNGSATKGYEITRLEFERDALLNAREQHNISLSDSQTLATIREESLAKGMRVPQQVEYYYPVQNRDVALLTY